MSSNKVSRRARIKKSIRNKLSGTADRPRLSVFRSNKNIYAQLIDDTAGVTLASAASSLIEGNSEEAGKISVSNLVGKEIAAKAQEKGISQVVFDRSGYLYHGRVKSLAEGAREAGLKF